MPGVRWWLEESYSIDQAQPSKLGQVLGAVGVQQECCSPVYDEDERRVGCAGQTRPRSTVHVQ